ncbi:MAG: YHYH protein [Neoaquamicrobium sediminum]|uniref:YHYH protein n=1 Tax=Neoaquamicrobium sediminum TaxID=1849104 RepID=UPI004035F232
MRQREETVSHQACTETDYRLRRWREPAKIQESPIGPSPVVGFAADGFSIFGSYIKDDGGVRKATTSYQLKMRTCQGGPSGTYDGTFIDDWEYVAGSGDLDKRNGMVQEGICGYVVTDSYPHVLGCFSGTADSSFQKRRR